MSRLYTKLFDLIINERDVVDRLICFYKLPSAISMTFIWQKGLSGDVDISHAFEKKIKFKKSLTFANIESCPNELYLPDDSCVYCKEKKEKKLLFQKYVMH